jgi:hypothetical protein
VNPYTDVAQDQLEAITNDALYDDAIDLCEEILADPSAVRTRSSAYTTSDGIVMMVALAGHFPWKVFWSNREPDGLRIEAVISYDR